MLKMPVFGPLMRKADHRALDAHAATMFAAGVPLVEALDSVAALRAMRVLRRDQGDPA